MSATMHAIPSLDLVDTENKTANKKLKSLQNKTEEKPH